MNDSFSSENSSDNFTEIAEDSKSKIWILTLFPEYFHPLLNSGVISRFLQQKNSPIEIKIIQIRDWAYNSYGSVDDYPFGGGAGLIMRFDVLTKALIEGVFIAGKYDLSSTLLVSLLSDLNINLNINNGDQNYHSKGERKKLPLVLYTSPKGDRFNNEYAKRLAALLSSPSRNNVEKRDIVFIAGRYEGIDERFIEMFVEKEISVGDYVLSGGEIAILSIIDSVIRQVPGALGNASSTEEESFENNLLEAPQYTRPRKFLGKEIPEIYLSGHHAEMKKYRLKEAEKITEKLRPDIYKRYLDTKDQFNINSKNNENNKNNKNTER